MSAQERDAARDKIKSEKEAERTAFLSAKKSSPTTTAPQREVPVELQGAYNYLFQKVEKQVLDQLEAETPEKQAQMLAQMLTPGETGAPV